MIDGKTFLSIALCFPHTEAAPHFDRVGFKITGIRMFATYLEKDNTANIFLTTAEQKMFCEMDPKNVYPVANKWGEKGATTFDLNGVEMGIVQEALSSAYHEILKAKKNR